MKKKISALFAISLLSTIFAVLAFANNIVAVANWWSAFRAAGGDSEKFSAKASGFLPWLDWCAVDNSAVTTFIPALGLICVTVALFRLLCGRRMRVEDFPFFKGSDQLNVALGLFGTLWGIILIGYFRLDTVSMADLMMCLHTALFSTLTAVVWVFMLDRPLLRPMMRGLLEKSGLAESDEGDLEAAVGRLVARLDAASNAFDAREKAYEAAFELRLANYSREFETRLADYSREFEARQKEYNEFFTRRIAELEKQAGDERARAERLSAKISAVAEALR